ncbi:Mth938-like domain-containing protein [Allosphingosinicella indica]|uniref:Uncharacterized conserved protein, contains Mth938-like domain n=1 Tax=Allosphingosinicella indica TaxID=941907 RepID=A0A1X7G1Q8_9SPHN|nr:Mth938-like domain-containing protein [Allosphingosinicella indica]SMF62424.1 Uncharacterized conserved protein, contains Mth938-like domain [Allosphingosinicella indica]
MTARLDRAEDAAGPLVRAIGPDGFLIGEERFAAVLLTPNGATLWSPPPLAELAEADIAPLLALDPPPELILLGAGAATAFPPRSFVAALEARGIGVEAMDSRAAARTWALLRNEGRSIAAALMPIG